MEIIKKLSRKTLSRSGQAFLAASKRVYTYPQEARLTSWFAANGDNTLWLDHDDLNSDSIIFDLGGYEGRFTAEMLCRYDCKQIHVFEPVPEYAKRIKNRFRNNPRVLVHTFGLSDRNDTMTIGVAEDGSSIFKPGNSTENIQLICAADFIDEHRLERIDMVKINIEGGEYDLLDHLIEKNLHQRMSNIQVQFHPFVPDARARMDRIHQHLMKSHELTYHYPFVWENWMLKK